MNITRIAALVLLTVLMPQRAWSLTDEDLQRGIAVLREDTPFYLLPNEKSELAREELEVGRDYFALGLSLNSQWVHLLTRRNQRGWVHSSKVIRIPREEDPDLYDDFMKLVERNHWTTSRWSLNMGVYPTQDYIGELGLTILPRGIGGLKGESLELVGGAIAVKKTANVEAHIAYRALLQWPFRMMTSGNLHVGPRLGYEIRKRYDPVAIQQAEFSHFAVLGLTARYMPSANAGFSIVPEFLIHPKEARFRAFVAFTLML